MQELRDDEVGDRVVDLLAEEDDPLVEQAGVDVERALAAGALLDDHGDQRHGALRSSGSRNHEVAIRRKRSRQLASCVTRPRARAPVGSPAMPLRVVALPTGRVQVHPRQTRAVGPDALRPLAVVVERGFTEPLPVLSWAVVHPDGVIVVDAGQAPDFAAPWWDVYTRTAVRFHVAPEDALPARLREAGLDPGDVRLHVLTHLHVDHVGFAGALPAARLVCTAEEAAAAARPGARLRGYIGVDGVEGVGARRRGRRALRALAAPDRRRHGAAAAHARAHRRPRVGARRRRRGPEGPPGRRRRLRPRAAPGRVDRRRRRPRRAGPRDSSPASGELCARAPTVVLPTHDPASERRLAARTPTVTA